MKIKSSFSLLRLILSTSFFLCFCGSKPTSPAPALMICGQNVTISFHKNAERFGFFSESLYVDYKKYVASFSEVYGAKPGFLLWFGQIDNAFPKDFVTYCAAQSIKPVLSIDIRSIKLDSLRNDTLLREISNGLWDDSLKSFALQAKQAATAIYFRFGYEMNGNWFPWGGKPNDFIPAWNHAHKVFQNAGGNNIVWVFSPGTWDGSEASRDPFAYYPGDSVVDIVGVDGYNWGDFLKDGYQLHWQSFQEVFGLTLTELKTLGKPLWITEIGCATDARRPEWIKEFLLFMDNNPCVESALWFNDYKKTIEPDFRLESDTATLSLMRNWMIK